MKTHLNLLCFLSLLFLMLLVPIEKTFCDESLIVYTSGHSLRVTTQAGQDVIRLEYVLWGPNWAWSGIDGTHRTEGNAVIGDFKGQIGRTNVPFTIQTRLTPIGKRQLKIEGEFKTSADSGLTRACLALGFDAPVRGQDRAIFTDAIGTKTIRLSPTNIKQFYGVVWRGSIVRLMVCV